MTTQILIVEDEPAIQVLLAHTLKQAGFAVLQAQNAETAMEMINDKLPDLVLLDWMLPKMSGIELARLMRRNERTKLLPIIMLTARVGESDKVSGLEIGADDYITKPFSPRELTARIKAVLRRRLPERSDDMIEINGLRLDPATYRISVSDREVTLGPTEFRLLLFLMTHAERVYTRSQLLDRVWGDHVFVEDRTIDVHIRRLRKALEVVGKDKLLQTVRGSGYRFTTSTEASVK
ncbi:MAG: DNA-binding response regulator [Nitrosomonas sp.]|nr:MAG: DNA-binding response regulator [Nitrosomonas sp.]